MDSHVLCSGWFLVGGHGTDKNEDRYFVLSALSSSGKKGVAAYKLTYYRSLDEYKAGTDARGTIDLGDVVFVGPAVADNNVLTLSLVTRGRDWCLTARNPEDYAMWSRELVSLLQDTNRRSKFRSTKEGMLMKKGRVVPSWKRRYFCVGQGRLFYFESAADCLKFKRVSAHSQAMFDTAMRRYAKGCLHLAPSSRVRHVTRYEFEITVFNSSRMRRNTMSPRNHHLATSSTERMLKIVGCDDAEVESWMEHLRAEIEALPFRNGESFASTTTTGSRVSSGDRRSVLRQTQNTAASSSARTVVSSGRSSDANGAEQSPNTAAGGGAAAAARPKPPSLGRSTSTPLVIDTDAAPRRESISSHSDFTEDSKSESKENATASSATLRAPPAQDLVRRRSLSKSLSCSSTSNDADADDLIPPVDADDLADDLVASGAVGRFSLSSSRGSELLTREALFDHEPIGSALPAQGTSSQSPLTISLDPSSHMQLVSSTSTKNLQHSEKSEGTGGGGGTMKRGFGPLSRLSSSMSFRSKGATRGSSRRLLASASSSVPAAEQSVAQDLRRVQTSPQMRSISPNPGATPPSPIAHSSPSSSSSRSVSRSAMFATNGFASASESAKSGVGVGSQDFDQANLIESPFSIGERNDSFDGWAIPEVDSDEEFPEEALDPTRMSRPSTAPEPAFRERFVSSYNFNSLPYPDPQPPNSVMYSGLTSIHHSRPGPEEAARALRQSLGRSQSTSSLPRKLRKGARAASLDGQENADTSNARVLSAARKPRANSLSALASTTATTAPTSSAAGAEKATDHAQITLAQRSMLAHLAAGGRFVRHSKRTRPTLAYVTAHLVEGVPRLSWRWGRSSRGRLDVRDIRHVKVGKHTAVFRKEAARLVPETRCLTVVSDRRTLNLEALSDEQCIRWVEALVVCFDVSVEMT